MNTHRFIQSATVVAVASLFAGCSTWGHMEKTEKGTAVGATGGALAGAAVGGPVGAAVGAGVGGYAGHYEAKKGGVLSEPLSSKNNPKPTSAAAENRSDMTTTGTAADRAATTNAGTQGMTQPGTAIHDESMVRSVQQSLERRGFDVGPVDGVWGDKTQSAVREFQQANNLPQTGNLDQRTLDALGVSR